MPITRYHGGAAAADGPQTGHIFGPTTAAAGARLRSAASSAQAVSGKATREGLCAGLLSSPARQEVRLACLGTDGGRYLVEL